MSLAIVITSLAIVTMTVHYRTRPLPIDALEIKLRPLRGIESKRFTPGQVLSNTAFGGIAITYWHGATADFVLYYLFRNKMLDYCNNFIKKTIYKNSIKMICSAPSNQKYDLYFRCNFRCKFRLIKKLWFINIKTYPSWNAAFELSPSPVVW